MYHMLISSKKEGVAGIYLMRADSRNGIICYKLNVREGFEYE